jgi:hypothetical protein
VQTLAEREKEKQKSPDQRKSITTNNFYSDSAKPTAEPREITIDSRAGLQSIQDGQLIGQIPVNDMFSHNTGY